VTYPIAFACYGHHLLGSESGSVDRNHCVPGTPILEANSARTAADRERMKQPPYDLDQIRRDAVWEAIHEVCTHRGWSLLAVHVRSNHVHMVVGKPGTGRIRFRPPKDRSREVPIPVGLGTPNAPGSGGGREDRQLPHRSAPLPAK
jgi:hypothetical protein